MLLARPRYVCRECRSWWTSRPGGRAHAGASKAPGGAPSLRRHRRGFLRRHPSLVVALALVLSLAAGYLLALLLGLVPEGMNYLKTEKFFTGSTGKKYTIGEAIDKAVKKSKEGE